MKKVYNFRLNKGDGEIKEILEKRAGSESSFIKTAILFYGRFGEKIDNMAATIEEIRAALKGEESSQEGPEEQPKNPDVDAEKMIRESIMDIIHMGDKKS